jgi:hypothetical protein
VIDPSNPLSEIVETLTANGYVKDAQLMESQVPKLASLDPTERAAAAGQIISMCHPKWLGDLDVPRRDWWDVLDKARVFARKAAKAPKTGRRSST